MRLIHERTTGWPALLAGLLAALSAACGGGAGEAPEGKPSETRQALSTYHATSSVGAITLRDRQGNPIARGSTTPYSPQRTCGACHDVDVITQGYHFQQGKGLSNTAITMSDTYNAAKPWLLSDGMYGKW